MPLHLAVWNQDLTRVISLANSDSVKQKDGVGYTPLHLACSDSNSMLFSSRQVSDRNLKSRIISSWNDPRCFASRHDNENTALQLCKALLDAGADPNAVTSQKAPWTPMHCVANSGWMEVAHLLLEHGGSAFAETICSPYCWASEGYGWRQRISGYGEAETMRELLKFHLSQEQLDALHKSHGLVRRDVNK
jgi:ankyrin repeat protein